MNTIGIAEETLPTLRHTLLELARVEDDCAAAEAAAVPYWSPCPSSVQAHRIAATVLRAAADSFLRIA
jgi:hypothetical protein